MVFEGGLIMYKDGIMGVIIGDALGCPVQFMSREEVARKPVRGMRGYGTFDMPPGTWTDDGSMTLATLASIKELKKINLDDIMSRFVRWFNKGEYTPFGFPFDQGLTCTAAIREYERYRDTDTCGGRSERANGNGALMRIMPVCIYALKLNTEEAIGTVHEVAGLTHNHIRGLIACGLYFFMVRAIVERSGSLTERLQAGIDEGFTFYEKNADLSHYMRLRDLKEFRGVQEKDIRSSGYVVDSLEAAVWCLINTEDFRSALLKAVNLGDDSDTVGAICGGLAGLYYGYESIPEEWLMEIKRLDWIENLCEAVEK
jgi:ADP-ribosylglycohydrolase